MHYVYNNMMCNTPSSCTAEACAILSGGSAET